MVSMELNAVGLPLREVGNPIPSFWQKYESFAKLITN
jgi:hypothetical protein